MAYGFQIRTTAGFVDLGDIRSPRRVYSHIVGVNDHVTNPYSYTGAYNAPAGQNLTKANSVVTIEALDNKEPPFFQRFSNGTVTWRGGDNNSKNFRIDYWKFT
ncbi:hypothetical protein [Paracoccus sp. MKU1]|uniref:hypothetical protein n=1 Tax=Paracoccus sp. MKU1 TaxID=1745182 RepID=UPI0007191175|nr:hypothetical protein [Paracoccus sp. MKU1]KRW94314.1 hypothetical protein AQY21_20510 [Paracoccus sp. MKU1]